MRTICVVGAKGFIGQHLVRALTARGLRVLALSSVDGTGISPQTGLLPKDFEFSEPVDAVVYAAQSPRYRDAAQASHVLSVNVTSAVRAALASCRAGASRFIYLSTGNVYAPSFEPLRESSPVLGVDWYSLSKIQAEQALNLFRADMDIHIVRLFGVYGKAQQGRLVPNLITSIRAGRPINLQGRKDDPRDIDGLRISICNVDDIVSILINLITFGGPNCLNLAGENPISIRALANQLGELLGLEPFLVAGQGFRNFDLVADISLLRESQPSLTFTAITSGLKDLIKAS